MSDNPTSKELILRSLQEKAGLKLDVYRNLESAFKNLKAQLKQLESEIRSDISRFDKRVTVKYIDRGPFDAEFRISDDVLIFSMHTNIFTFDPSHGIWKNSYVKENGLRAFVGMISVYNFLTDSFNFNRINDMGYLIARIFMNNEMHFFVEGKRQLGFLYNDFGSSRLDPAGLRSIIESAVLYSLNFDIFTPPFDEVKVLSVQEVVEKKMSSLITTGKRLGFKFQSDSDMID